MHGTHGHSETADTRMSRFQEITAPLRTSSLHRIRTALSPSTPRNSKSRAVSPPSAYAYAASDASTGATSPLSEPRSRNSLHEDWSLSPLSARSSYYNSNYSDSPRSVSSSVSRLRQALSSRALGRRPSMAALAMEEEKKSFPVALDILEPRPAPGFAAGGISEVLEGTA